MDSSMFALGVGDLLHWYSIDAYLGQGGFGITYKAIDKNLDREVAIKEYLPSDLAIRSDDRSITPNSRDKEKDYYLGLKRFLDEGKTLAKFEHRNLVRVLAVFEANNTGYMVMSYERGVTLADHLSKHGSLSEQEIQSIFSPLLDAIDAVHKRGFIHRDIKPSNIIIRNDGTPVLIDFGSARHSIGQLTKSITSIVSPGYAPIEQYFTDSEAQGPWTDIYAVGATMYRSISGATPVDAVARSQATKKIGRSTLVPLAEFSNGAHSKNLIDSIEAAMSVDLEERPQSINEFRESLRWQATDQSTDDDATSLNPNTPVNKSSASSRVTRSTIPLGVLLGACILATAIYLSRENDQRSDAVSAPGVEFGAAAEEDLWANSLKQFELGNYASAKEFARQLVEAGDYRGEFLIGAAIWGGDSEVEDRREGERLITPLIPEIEAHARGGDHWARTMLGVLYANGIGVEPDLGKAENLYKQALEIEPTNVWAQALLGIVYTAQESSIQNPELAFKWTSAAASQGFSRSQLRLAWMYANEYGTTKDIGKAVDWATKAADQGNAEAQYELALIYESGEGVPQNEQRSIELHEAAAKSGYSKSLLALGKRYRYGNGVHRDEAKAFELVRRAAEQGLPTAEAELGSLYEAGSGVAKDNEKAVQWYRRAAAHGSGFAEALLGFHYQYGVGVPKDLAEAEKLFRSSSDKGFLYGQYMLGTALLAREDESLREEAITYLERAHKDGFLLASRALGSAYISGVGTDKDTAKAFSILVVAADEGDVGSQALVGDMLRSGIGVDEDAARATSYFRMAAEQGDRWGMFGLGRAYLAGEGVDIDNVQGFEWVEKAGIRGLREAHELLALLYSEGRGVPPNKVEAYAWANVAIAEGLESSRELRDEIAKDLTLDEVQRAADLSHELFEKYARN